MTRPQSSPLWYRQSPVDFDYGPTASACVGSIFSLPLQFAPERYALRRIRRSANDTNNTLSKFAICRRHADRAAWRGCELYDRARVFPHRCASSTYSVLVISDADQRDCAQAFDPWVCGAADNWTCSWAGARTCATNC